MYLDSLRSIQAMLFDLALSSYVVSFVLFSLKAALKKSTAFPTLQFIGHAILISTITSVYQLSQEISHKLKSSYVQQFIIMFFFCIVSFYVGWVTGRNNKVEIKTEETTININSPYSKQQKKFTIKSKSKPGSTFPVISDQTFPIAAALPEEEEAHTIENDKTVSKNSINSSDNHEPLGESHIQHAPEEPTLSFSDAYNSTIIEAKSTLLSILELRHSDNNAKPRLWVLVRSNSSTHLWISRGKTDGILIRGVASTNALAKQVMTYIMDQNLTLGIESIVYRSEDVKPLLQGSTTILLRRIRSKSGTLMGLNREFIVITSISEEADGSYVIASRSIPNNLGHSNSSSSQSLSASSSSTHKKVKADKKASVSIRGVIHATGYVIKPRLADSNIVGSEISFATHLDFMGSKFSRTNSIKADILIGALYKSMENIREDVEKVSPTTSTASMSDTALLSKSASIPTSLAKPLHKVFEQHSKLQTSEPLNNKRNEPAAIEFEHVEYEQQRESAAAILNFEDTKIELSDEQKSEIFSVARKALSRLRGLHKTFSSNVVVNEQSSEGGGPIRPRLDSDDDIFIDDRVNYEGNRERKWETFYDHDGITVKELSDNVSPIGILNATCSTQAPPHVVRKLLLEHPDAIDGLLAGRAVLCNLNNDTYLQWLAYGAIWPVGARDFLLVTTEEPYDKSTGEGFALVSTSIDHICELEEDSDSKLNNDTHYSRSHLRLAGYIGTPNASGGTDVFLFVEVDVYSYIPAWLLQILAQYGLSEIMTRIRGATTTNGRKTAGYELNKILHQIQSREVKMRQYVGNTDSNTSTSDKVVPALGLAVATGSPPGKHVGGNMPSYLVSKLGAAGGDKVKSSTGSISSNDDEMSTTAVSGTTDEVTTDLEVESLPSSTVMNTVSVATDAPLVPVADKEHMVISPWRSSLPVLTGPFYSEGKTLANVAIQKIKVYLGLEPPPADEPLVLDWQLKATKKDINIWTCPVTGTPWQAIKGTTIIKADKVDILKLFVDASRIGEYDDMFDAFKFITSVDDRTEIKRVMFKAIWPTAPREFLTLSTWRETSDGSIIVATRSAPDVLCPPQKGFVRGFLHISGYLIQPYEVAKDLDSSVQPGHCKLTLTAHTELGGTLPVSIINMLATSAPMKMLAAVDEVVKC